MSTVLQRYKFESNSQQKQVSGASHSGCLLSCKDTNLKAIHNTIQSLMTRSRDVYCPAKIQIWKQFTTSALALAANTAMSTVLQRYKFESNSQPPPISGGSPWRCLLSCKDTNLKAIHNSEGVVPQREQMSTVLQRYKFESNSQLV